MWVYISWVGILGCWIRVDFIGSWYRQEGDERGNYKVKSTYRLKASASALPKCFCCGKGACVHGERSFDFGPSQFSSQCLIAYMVLLKQQVERAVILFSLVEKLRQYHGHEETPEMMAARIDRDVVSKRHLRPLPLF